ncbi:hypothetical protein FGG08_002237 [Glutinoglossum americanum]|uniref:Uncharacterized protein n=1 Tax=Glutinoglossum americanum TaxID=1670608 RepID=A0A9P8L1X8_9PEZI|nr:hypothetical protein FGG08_002237 [Glutinoglossum americanum]
MVVLGMDLFLEIGIAGRGSMFVFFMGNISLVIQLVYYCITAYWTYLHFKEPSTATSNCQSDCSLWNRFKPRFEIPRESSRYCNRLSFSIFYTAAVSIPFTVTTIFWLILVPSSPANDLEVSLPEFCSKGWLKPFCDGWLRAFVLVGLYLINSVIALIEIVVLSSIKRQWPVWAHVAGLVAICAAYVGWLYLGRLITGSYAYKWIDPSYQGWEHAVIAIAAAISISVCMFAVQYGLHGLREKLAARRRQGYSRL